jgi:hypothetical protein
VVPPRVCVGRHHDEAEGIGCSMPHGPIEQAHQRGAVFPEPIVCSGILMPGV